MGTAQFVPHARDTNTRYGDNCPKADVRLIADRGLGPPGMNGVSMDNEYDDEYDVEEPSSSEDLFLGLTQIGEAVRAGIAYHFDSPARFAGTSIVSEQPEPVTGGFYPEDRVVVTAHGPELAGLFRELVRVFGTAPGYGFWKEELFGRLGNSASWYIARNPDCTAQELALAVVCEAFQIADEMAWGDGEMPGQFIVVDNLVLDDSRDPFLATRPQNAAEVRQWFAGRGFV